MIIMVIITYADDYLSSLLLSCLVLSCRLKSMIDLIITRVHHINILTALHHSASQYSADDRDGIDSNSTIV